IETGIAGAHGTLHHQYGTGLVSVQNRHAVDGAGRIGAGGGVDHVVGADHQDDVRGGEIAVDLFHFQHHVVRNFGLGQQYVHVAGHTAGDRVDGIANLDAFLVQQFRELLENVLSARYRQTVAGYDDHGVRIAHQE